MAGKAVGEQGREKVLKEEGRTAAENLAIARCHHQVARQNLNAPQSRANPSFGGCPQRKGWETEICLKEGSESDTPETVTQHLNFILLPILHSDRPDSWEPIAKFFKIRIRLHKFTMNWIIFRTKARNTQNVLGPNSFITCSHVLCSWGYTQLS